MTVFEDPKFDTLRALIEAARQRARRRRIRRMTVALVGGAIGAVILTGHGGSHQTPPARAGRSAAPDTTAVSKLVPGVPATRNGPITIIQQVDGGVVRLGQRSPSLPDRPSGLFQLGADGRPRPLWLCPPGCGDIYSFAWSPDGTQIAIAATSDSNSSTPLYQGLHVITPATGQDRWIARAPKQTESPYYYFDGKSPIDFSHDQAYANLAWSRDGRRIAFAAGGSKLGVMDSNGGHRHLIDTGEGPVSDPTWSPSGRSIAFAGHNGVWVIAVRWPHTERHLSWVGAHLSWSAIHNLIALSMECGFRLITPHGEVLREYRRCPRSHIWDGSGRSTDPARPNRAWPQMVWSPAEDQLVMAETLERGQSLSDGIWTIGINGRHLRHISQGHGSITNGYGVGYQPEARAGTDARRPLPQPISPNG